MPDDPEVTDEDFLARQAAKRAEADALLADPDVHTPTDTVDGNEDLSAR
jgi:hypothetical protein